MKNYGKNDARDYCANWNSGKCLGCMMRTDGDVLKIRVDSKLESGRQTFRNCGVKIWFSIWISWTCCYR